MEGVEEKVPMLKEKAIEIRKEILKMLNKAGSGHTGGSLSLADLMAVLYFKYLRVDPGNPEDPDRDRLVLSKGHAAPAIYAALGLKGFFDKKELDTLRKIDSILQGHPDMTKTPGVEMTTGSLGQGLSAANGMAISAKLDDRDLKVVAILGDGEIQEGQIWEAAMTASHYKLDNLVGIVDYNGLQIDGKVEDIKNPAPLAEKWRAFGWHVMEIDGHDISEIDSALNMAAREEKRPTMIVARTVKGKGVSFMENNADWHGKGPSDEELEKALKEIDAAFDALKEGS